MRINFFSEFPDKELKYAEDLQDGAIVFMAADSIEKFRGYKEQLNEINPDVEPGYWPYFEESVWVSPFVKDSELDGLEKELAELDSKVMFDIEPPTVRPKQFLNLRGFWRRKRRIQEMADKYSDQVYFVEQSRPVIVDSLYRVAGLSFSGRRVEMLYSSMVPNWVIGHLRRQMLKRGVDYPAFGVTDQGPLEKEDILSEEQLRNDLEWAESNNFDEVFIYRLEGLERFRAIFEDFF